MGEDGISSMEEKKKEEDEATRIQSTEGNVAWIVLVRSKEMKAAASLTPR